MAESTRERDDRQRNAVAREFERLRATDAPDGEEPTERDFVDSVAEEQRERDERSDGAD
jgi:hypothetical protein